MSALFTQCPGDTVQTGTGKVDPAWKIKCTTAARDSVDSQQLENYFFYFPSRKVNYYQAILKSTNRFDFKIAINYEFKVVIKISSFVANPANMYL